VRQALTIRLRLSRLWEELIRLEIDGVRSTGELGTIANLEQRSRLHQHILDKDDVKLAAALGEALPPQIAVEAAYSGRPRILMLTVRRSAGRGESVVVRPILVAQRPPARAVLRWRALGNTRYQSVRLVNDSRSVFRAALPALGPHLPAIEYYLEADLDGQTVRWPADAPAGGQTLIMD
jgi:hypothetical protein